MIPIVEELLRQTVVDGIKNISTNPEIINRMFLHASPAYVSRLQAFLRSNKIGVMLNFPKEPANLPCYCINLGGEDEDSGSLGDLSADGYDEVSVDEIEETFVVQTFYLDGSLKNIYLGVSIGSYPVAYIDFVKKNGESIPYRLDEDNPKEPKIILDSALVAVGDTVQVKLGIDSKYASFYGILMSFNYRIECWSDNADLTAYMYHMLKYIMLTNKLNFQKAGIILPRYSGGDFEPIPDYFPSFVYRRAFNISGKVSNTYLELVELIEDVSVNTIN